MRTTWSFCSAGRVEFGRGAFRRLGDLLCRQGVQQTLVLTDAGVAAAGHAEEAARRLAAAGIRTRVNDQVQPEPDLDSVRRCAEAARRQGAASIVGLGGGSAMDTAKLVAAALVHGGDPEDYLGLDRVPGPTLPLALVPTTAGSGSEVSHAAVVADPQQEMKRAAVSGHLRPALALVDPELTRTCPATVTVAGGIDALTHAIEAFTAVDYSRVAVRPDREPPYQGRTPWTCWLALAAIERIAGHLPRAVAAADDLTAREQLSLAALEAGLAFANAGVGLVHALEAPLSAAIHAAHGAVNGVLLPHAMRRLLPAAEAEFARVAAALGVPAAGLSSREAAAAAVDAVERLLAAVGAPRSIRQLAGADFFRSEPPIELWAARAHSMRVLLALCPERPTQEDLAAIYRAALE